MSSGADIGQVSGFGWACKVHGRVGSLQHSPRGEAVFDNGRCNADAVP
jgi:hypothetical protein